MAKMVRLGTKMVRMVVMWTKNINKNKKGQNCKRLQLSKLIMAKQTLGGSWLRLSFDDR